MNNSLQNLKVELCNLGKIERFIKGNIFINTRVKMKETQELVCHCGRVNTFPINPNRDGNYIIVCKCGHEHCRVCVNGKVTSERLDSKFETSNVRPTQVKYTQQQLGRRDSFLSGSWLNTVFK